MTTVDQIRNNLISKLMKIKDQEFLQAMDHIVSKSSQTDDLVEISEVQEEMLKMSDVDIAYGAIHDQIDLFEKHRQWLKEK